MTVSASHVILAVIVGISGAGRIAAQASTTTVILVRHADRASDPLGDTPLTEAGRARARDLAAALSAAGVQTIITTQYSRTKDTAAPLARLLGLGLEVIADSGGASHAVAVANVIRDRHRGETVLVVDHGHSVPRIIAELGAPLPSAICETTFDHLFIVTVPVSGVARVISVRYGSPSMPDSACSVSR